MTVRCHNAAAAAGKHAGWQKPESMLSCGHAPHFNTACGQEAGSQCVFSQLYAHSVLACVEDCIMARHCCIVEVAVTT